MSLLGRKRAQQTTRPHLQPIPAWSWMLAAVISVAVTALVVTIWLLAIASHAKAGTDQANARLDAVRTGLAAGAGAGAAVGLMLAFRRQHHQEIATAQTDEDATERRITELYTKAVEQLGSDKAPVRLGGLYALERLAQGNETQRQTIVNVICAYLRMPFPPQPPASRPATVSSGNAAAAGAEAPADRGGGDDNWQQEKQVRLTAQHILADHLRQPEDSQQEAGQPAAHFWDRIDLNLVGATLIDFDLANGKVTGDAAFSGATFTGDAAFDGATFTGQAEFDRATFTGNARFGWATFTSDAWFNEASFTGDARFDEATFTRQAGFDEATFTRQAGFDRASFTGDAKFDEATFTGSAWFGGATFTRRARFDEAIFTSDARFGGTIFSLGPDAFDFTNAHVRSADSGHVWPAGWQLDVDSQGEQRVVRVAGT